MRSSLLLLLLAAACGRPDDQLAIAAPAPPPVKADPIVKGVPHGGHITQVAVTEGADAALTFDTTGGVRLWPALDGWRTPLPLAVTAPDQLSLSHAGRDLLAAIRDEAGGVRILRLGRDGSVRGDAQIPADIAVKQVIALDGSVLVRRDDQSIEWYTADGESRGRLVAEPSQRVQAIAARHGSAVAIVTDGTKYHMRWLITLGTKLSWGGAYELPAPVEGDRFALSPSHHRIAFVDPQRNLAVYELGLVPTRVGNTMFADTIANLGFVDEDHIALMGSSLRWWAMPQQPAKDPWEVPTTPSSAPTTRVLGSGGAIADGLAVMGYGAALSLTDTAGVKYLGYREHGVGNVGAANGALWVTMTGSHVVWLDDKLGVVRDIELRKAERDPWVYATPVSDRHVITQTTAEGKYKIDLVDVDSKAAPISIGSFPSVERVELSPETGILGLSTYTKIHRFKVDLATNTVTPMPALKTRGSLVQMRLFDPAKTDGVAAITLGWANEYDEDYTLTIYREKGTPKRIRPLRGRVIEIGSKGTIYVANGSRIETWKSGKKVSSFEVDKLGSAVAVNADGSRFAVNANNEVIVVDDKGALQWRTPLWGTQQLVFTKDGKHLAVRANGGLLLLDAATGQKKAMECGWTFSLMTLPPNTNALASAPVCEDPMLQ